MIRIRKLKIGGIGPSGVNYREDGSFSILKLIIIIVVATIVLWTFFKYFF